MLKCYDSRPFSPTYDEKFGCIGTYPNKQPYGKEAMNTKTEGDYYV